MIFISGVILHDLPPSRQALRNFIIIVDIKNNKKRNESVKGNNIQGIKILYDTCYQYIPLKF